jgi:hypothetical protein
LLEVAYSSLIESGTPHDDQRYLPTSSVVFAASRTTGIDQEENFISLGEGTIRRGYSKESPKSFVDLGPPSRIAVTSLAPSSDLDLSPLRGQPTPV